MKDELELPHIPEWSVVLEQNAADLEGTLNALEDAHMQTMGWDPLMDWVPNDNELMSLARAVCLPILGGRMFMSLAMSIPSQHISVKTLRGAIDSEALACHRPNKNIFVTTAGIKDWIASCQERPSPRDSKSERPDTRQTVSSRTKPNGASTTDQRELTRSAALRTLQALKLS